MKLLWTVVALLLVCQVAACVVGVGPSLSGKVDLRAFYAAGTIARSTHAASLYNYEYQRVIQNAIVSRRAAALPFLYPPFAALVFVPLSLLPYKAAFLVFLLMNLILFGATGWLLRAELPGIHRIGWYVLPATYGCLLCVAIALMQGQISPLLLLLYSVAWVLLERNRGFLAGAALSLCLIKFQTVLPVVLLFLFWNQWKVIAGFIGGSFPVAGVSLLTVGRAGVWSYWGSLRSVAAQGAADAGAAKARFGMFPTDMPNLHGITFGLSQGMAWGHVLNLILCIAVLVFAARQKASLIIALPAAMLVSYHMQPHDLTLLLLPLSVLTDRVLRREAGETVSGTLGLPVPAIVAMLLLLTFPVAPLLMAHGLGYLAVLAVGMVLVAACHGGGQSAGCPVNETPDAWQCECAV